MSSPRLAITLRGVSKQFLSGAWGVRDLSLSLADGHCIALVGANGAGKTTALHLMAGIIAPTSGEVEVTADGRRLPNDWLGWSSQRDTVDWLLTTYENVLFGAKLAGLRTRAARHAAQEAMALVGLTAPSDQTPDSLSGGELRRMQIARALAHRPKVILLDEPTSGLDPFGTDRVLTYLRERADAGALVVVSSHDLNVLGEYCTKVIHLRRGVLLAACDPTDYLRPLRAGHRLRFEYTGELDTDTLAQLERLDIRILSLSPLDVVLEDRAQAAEVRDILSSACRVVGERSDAGTFREAFLLRDGALPVGVQ